MKVETPEEKIAMFRRAVRVYLTMTIVLLAIIAAKFGFRACGISLAACVCSAVTFGVGTMAESMERAITSKRTDVDS